MPEDAKTAENILTLRAAIDAPRDLLWRYVSTAEGLACWQADRAQGSLETGNFSLTWPDLGARLDLSVAELELGHRLVLRAGATALDLRVEDGVLELHHHGLDSEDDIKGFESSWLTALALLEVGATRHPRKSRMVRWFFERVEIPAELLQCYFMEAPALATWLGSSPRDLVSREDYLVHLFGGETMSGRVMHAERDVCLHVSEWSHGALTMRSLPGPEATRVAALGVSTWDESAPTHVAPTLQGALHRLSSATQSRE